MIEWGNLLKSFLWLLKLFSDKSDQLLQPAFFVTLYFGWTHANKIIVASSQLALPSSYTFYDVDKYNEEEKSKQVSGDLIVARQMTAIKFNDFSCASNYTFPPRGLSSIYIAFSYVSRSSNILLYK